MTLLMVKTRAPSRPWRTTGPGLPVETGAGTIDPSRAHLDDPADAIRARRLLGTELRHIAHPSFDDPDARDAILAPMPAPDGAQAPRRTHAPEGMHPYLASLYDAGPLLSRAQEAHLFRQMNYLLSRADRLRDRIDPDRPRAADLDALERLLEEARAVKAQIVRANLRLVVAIGKRYAGPDGDLLELVSDGNLTLMSAVERFDFARGYRFSTYATWAIRNALARALRRKSRRHPQILVGCHAALENAPAPCSDELEQPDVREGRAAAVARWLDQLDDRKRRIIVGRYGIGGAPERTLAQLGRELGISKERVRQLEARAEDQLRSLAQTEANVLALPESA